MDYFSKVKNATLKAAAQGMQFIQSVASAASDISGYSLRTPEEEALFRFRSACQLIDEFCALDDISTNRDAAYYDARIKECIRELLQCLQMEDKKWVNQHMQSGTSELKDHPVLELFLQHRVMEELCTRAIHDKPQGLLPVVLAATTSIMRSMHYPLLPHQRVHKPLSQLLTHATDLSAQYALAAKRLPSSERADLVSYTRRIDSNLANLILCLWRKIFEAPQTLDFFSFIDKSVADASGVTVREVTASHHQLVQLDLVKCLIPLMGKQKIGATAKEALLLAVSLHDIRINYYILHETRLMHNVVTELSKKYLQSVDSLLLSCGPSSPGASAPIVTHDATTAFEKVLRFCSALALSASSHTASTNNAGIVFITEKSTDLFAEICREVRDVFVATCLIPLIMEHAEQQVIATQAVCRLMLRELIAGSSAIGLYSNSTISNTHIHPIALLISHELIRNNEICDALLARASSASKDVSLSTLLLLESLVCCAGLTDLELLFLHCSEEISASEENSVPASTNIDNVLNTLQFPSQSTAGDDVSKTSKKVPASVEQYMNYAVDCIMSRSHFSFTSTIKPAAASVSELKSGLGRGSLLCLLIKKLKCFSSLRFEEQLAVTGVVQQAVNFLCVVVCSSDDTHKAQVAFVELLNVFKTIKSAEREISCHVKQISDSSYKMEVVRAILSSSDAVSAAKLRKVIEKDGSQVIRILESTVLLRELIHELHGYLLAVKKLRVIFCAETLNEFTLQCEHSFASAKNTQYSSAGDARSECASVSDDESSEREDFNDSVKDNVEDTLVATEQDFEKEWSAMNDMLCELAASTAPIYIDGDAVSSS